jgi:glycosyltransferase involved in cell wall biosynthesis
MPSPDSTIPTTTAGGRFYGVQSACSNFAVFVYACRIASTAPRKPIICFGGKADFLKDFPRIFSCHASHPRLSYSCRYTLQVWLSSEAQSRDNYYFTNMNTLCLSIIVKNEESVIERCLKSARPFINYCMISDTGSEDNTVAKIQELFKTLSLPGEVHSDKWVNFAHNRNLSLERCAGKTDYVLFMDADEIITDPKNELPIKENLDAFYGKSTMPHFEFEKVRICRNDGNWEWRGAIHEYLHCKKTHEIKKTSIAFTDLGDGDRNRSGSKFYRDAIVLEEEYRKNPKDCRTLFYLAQTYEHLGILDKATDSYAERILAGGWEEEVYYSMFRLADIYYRITKDIHKSLNLYLNAFVYRPCRLESLLSACVKLRDIKAWSTIHQLTQNIRNTKTEDILFVDRSAEWRIVEEHGLAAYWLGKKDEAKKDFQHVLRYKLSDHDAARVKHSLSFV